MVENLDRIHTGTGQEETQVEWEFNEPVRQSDENVRLSGCQWKMCE